MTVTLLHPLGPGEHRITQHFGEHPEWYADYGLAGHEGLDFGVVVGTPVYASHDGTAIPASGTTYGQQVWVYGDGVTTVYAHLSGFTLGESGGHVYAGDQLGYSGDTGRSMGAHLHFGLKVSGEYVEGFRGWIDPEPHLEGKNVAQLWPQVQSPNYHDWLVDHARQLGGVKLLNPWRGEWQKFTNTGIPVLGRYIAANDADKELIWDGAAGAYPWFRDWFWPYASRCPGIALWEGPNEWPIFNAAQAQLLDAFTSALADIFHDHGLEIVGYQKNTHHWAYSLWQYLGESLSKIDYLGSHHYAYGARFQNDDTDGLYRLVKDVDAIRDYGYRVPPVIVSECGYDTDPREAVGHRGWLSRGIDRSTHTTEMVQYLLRLSSLVPELVAIIPFLWEPEDSQWYSFQYDQETSAILARKVVTSYAVPDTPPEPSVPLEERIRNAAWTLRNIPYNDDAAFPVYAREHGLGAPLTTEDYGQVDGYALQAFVGGIVYAKVGDWANVTHIPW